MAYRCSSCGYYSVKWMGRCPQCGEWDSFEDERRDEITAKETASPKPVSEISTAERQRLSTNIEELDRVLGGGLVAGSVVLFGGEPGVGKSTLLLQAAHHLSKQGPVLYVSGEESLRQIKLRADRLEINNENLFLFSGQGIDGAIEQISKIEPVCAIIDSIQSLGGTDSESTLGSTRQVRELGQKVTRLAKQQDIPILLVGHVTKTGDFAGPKAIEHLVDATFLFDGQWESEVRMLRPEKNRFGSTEGLGLFRMTEKGLQDIKNPSQYFAHSDNNESSPRGAAITCTIEGNRPILAEVQALVTPSSYSNKPQRRVTGLNFRRVALLLAVMEKHMGVSISASDIYLNVVGGFQLTETGADLAIIVALLSSFCDSSVDSRSVFIGEVGLSGKIRSVKKIGSRMEEISKLGYRRAVVPNQNFRNTTKQADVVPLTDLSELARVLKMDVNTS